LTSGDHGSRNYGNKGTPSSFEDLASNRRDISNKTLQIKITAHKQKPMVAQYEHHIQLVGNDATGNE